ncbi:superoxide dismutase family protein [Sphingomonas ginkgonis]|uniref:Superoxide dismutase family protein n=1 Tax=Sphingomonas ginkgonis TaxID=2315330 RepID=A0A3S0ENH2_9SPHN|nr:superoxide dismutase family protein [Sphingomonas ginkgonis]RST31595.1 superoxide dismutase family protein [Sphingomonas ginkgonis]
MKTAAMIGGGVAALLLAGCATMTPGAAPVRAPLMLADGTRVGEVSLVDRGDAVEVRLMGSGLPAGVHGWHLHAVGLCDGPKFTSAGGHWNPTARQHGHQNPAGFHQGDLGNFTVGADGRFTAGGTVSAAMLRGGASPLLDADGAALVVHTGQDDERTDPAGNSGDRIACAAFR